MESIYKTLMKYIVKSIVWIWDFVFLFLGVPYEEQANKLNSEEWEPVMGGPENEKTTHQFYRANKVSNEVDKK